MKGLTLGCTYEGGRGQRLSQPSTAALILHAVQRFFPSLLRRLGFFACVR